MGDPKQRNLSHFQTFRHYFWEKRALFLLNGQASGYQALWEQPAVDEVKGS